MMIDFGQAVSLLRQADDVLILTHINPDGDTLGSGFALLRALQKAGKRARLLNNDRINEKYSFLYEGIREEDFEEKFIVSVDVAEKKLLGEELSRLYGDRVDLSVDHHGTSRLFAAKTYSEPESASACELVYLIIKALGIEPDKKIADCIYTGCSTDTGCFRYSNVTPRTHRIAAELIEAGADHSRINTLMFDTKSFNNLMLERKCLDSLRLYGEGRIALIAVSQQMLESCSVDKAALDAIKPITRQIEGVKVGVTLKQEKDGKTGVSLRTDEDVDAAKICAHFGGGGHIRAAGCELDMGLEEAEKTVVDYILTLL